MQKLNLIDSWRVLHPSDHDFSFYSSVHKTYSRIDFFLIDSRLLQHVVSTEYHNRLLSDHAPVYSRLLQHVVSTEYHNRLLSDHDPDYSRLLQHVVSTEYHNRLLSDHDPDYSRLLQHVVSTEYHNRLLSDHDPDYSRLLQHVVSTEYHNRLLSDHAPVSLNLNIKYSRGNYSWKFDNMLLNDDKFCEYLSKKFTLFLETNDKGDPIQFFGRQ